MRQHIITVAAALLPLVFATTAHANSDDRDAGVCAGYLALLKRDVGVEIALSSGNNRIRMLNHAKSWIRDVQRSGNGQSAAYEGESACRKIGIRPGDYK